MHLIGIRSCSPIGNNAARLPRTEGYYDAETASIIIVKDDLPIVLDGGRIVQLVGERVPRQVAPQTDFPLATLAETASSREPGTSMIQCSAARPYARFTVHGSQ